jgi:hypothetical protein
MGAKTRSPRPLTFEQAREAIYEAVTAILARVELAPDGTPLPPDMPPLSFNGHLEGMILHEGMPETLTGLDIDFGDWSLFSADGDYGVVEVGATAGQPLWRFSK